MSSGAAAPGEACIGTPAALPVSVSAAAETAEREWLKKNITSLEFKTGRQHPKQPFTPVMKQLQQDCRCVLPARGPDPASRCSSSIEDYYKHEQRFAIMNPLVSFPGSMLLARVRCTRRVVVHQALLCWLHCCLG